MAYQTGHYYPFNGINCTSGTFWFPDGDALRTEITNAYLSLFGRYGESPNVDGYVTAWNNNGPARYGTITEMVRFGGDSNSDPPGSGEWNAVLAQGKHTGMALGSCPPLPVINSFSFSPSSVTLGSSSTLSWSISGTVATRSISPSVSISTNAGSAIITRSPSGSYTYTLVVTGARRTVSASTTLTVTTPPPPTVSFSASPLAFIRGSSSTLSWSVSGISISSVTLTDFGSVATSGTRSVSPIATRQYTLTATNPGGTTTRSVTITVYQPPNVTLSLDRPTIIRGQSTILNWVTTGDAGSASITPGIGAVNINGNRVVSPTVTTTYVINVSGLGGSDSDSITLIVYQPPTVDITGPASINYGQQGTLTYTATNIDISLRVTPTYNYRGSSVTGAVVNLPIGTTLSGSIATQIPYTDIGAFSVTYVIVATGNGGQESKQLIIPINVDETPTNFLIPESEDLLKSQDPVITPDAVVTSYEILIEDVDIPVEVKADRPILVDVNDQEIWNQIRSI